MYIYIYIIYICRLPTKYIRRTLRPKAGWTAVVWDVPHSRALSRQVKGRDWSKVRCWSTPGPGYLKFPREAAPLRVGSPPRRRWGGQSLRVPSEQLQPSSSAGGLCPQSLPPPHPRPKSKFSQASPVAPLFPPGIWAGCAPLWSSPPPGQGHRAGTATLVEEVVPAAGARGCGSGGRGLRAAQRGDACGVACCVC